jgi:hypothetical protein
MKYAATCLAVLASFLCVEQVKSEAVVWSIAEGGNGHYYERISPAGGITWTNAKVAAEGLSLAGWQGHLATITSQAEWSFVITTFPQSYAWIGLTDQVQEGNFQWVTGEPFSFSAWSISPQEPTNTGDEDYVFYESRSTGWGWNDYKNWQTIPASPSVPISYLVEYPVPEPSILVLLALGALSLLGYAWRWRKRAV